MTHQEWRLLLLLLVVVARRPRAENTADPSSGLLASSIHMPEFHYDIVHPVKTDERGSFISFDLSHRSLFKRAISSQSRPFAFYKLRHRGQELRFNLSLSRHLLAPGFVSERRYGGITQAKIQASHQNLCHMIGSVQNQEQEKGLAALSICDGMQGVFRLAHKDFFIEPLVAAKAKEDGAHPHRIYRRQALEYEWEELISVESTKQGRKPLASIRMCGVQENLANSEKRREKWEQKRQRKRRIKQRSISKEKWVETLVVADTKMVEYHGRHQVEKYVLTVMNMVAGLFHDASIGNPIHVSIVRLIFLEEEEGDLKITHHADNTLRSFCKWQKAINMKGDDHPLHHDVAILLTRKDLCAAMNRPCETLGLSHVSGMCQPHRSCNINEDTGLPLAFTVAHELGHSFGIQHDGSGNDCEPVGKRPFVMSPQLLYDTSPLTWSRCSRQYITRFLDRGWGLCLDDPPAKDAIDFPSVPPGVLYDVTHQCQLQYGPHSTYCDDMDSVCNTLWCSVGNTCHSKLDAAVDGTKCDEDRWCFNGECVQVGYRPEAINGGWAPWSSWAACSRTCGTGVQSAERECSRPTPKYGGRYCLGERKRFRVCNTKACPTDGPSFRHIQCSHFNARPYKGKLYKWIPIPNNINPCELHCRPEKEYFAERLHDAVVDGTPCHEGSSSRDLCINGICKNIGCDFEIDSYAMEDRCGVCRGNGSTCQTVKKTFEESHGLGYVDVGLIPAGAREIQIEEVAEAENFLALRSEDPDKYFLNGGWTIQWNGDYQVAGTTFTYERMGNWENLTSPGPTEEPVWIQLLFQEKNPGVRYQYTIQRDSEHENEITPAEFFWQYGPWTKCTATCGTGVQRQMVYCMEKRAGVVEEPFCDALSRPDDQQRPCSEEPCPARWWAGEWQACSATCGDAGLMKRTVLCLQSVALDEQRALLPSQCQQLSKPDTSAPCNREVLCPAWWVAGNWSECSVTCGSGTQWRSVYCSNGTGSGCDPVQRPVSKMACLLPPCWSRIESGAPEWSGSGSSSREVFNDIDFIPSHHTPKLSPSMPKPKGLNVIMEDYFSPTSNNEGNVFVDDFYYDYNFINFHEDLSYNPSNERDSKRNGLSPDFRGETIRPGEKDSKEIVPYFPPTVKPEDRTSKETTFSAEGQKDDEERSTAVSLHPHVGATPATFTTSSALLPHSTSGAITPLLASPSGRLLSTEAEPRTSTALEGGMVDTTSSTSSPSWATQTPTEPPGSQRSMSDAFSSTPHPGQKMLDTRNSVIPNSGHPQLNSLLNPIEKDSREQNHPAGTSLNIVQEADLVSIVKAVQITTATAKTGGTFHSLEKVKNFSAVAERDQPHPTGILKSKDTLSPATDLPPEMPTPASTHDLLRSTAVSSPDPNSLGKQSSTEPHFLALDPGLPSALPSGPPLPKWRESTEIKTSLDAEKIPSSGQQGLSGDRNKTLTHGAQWIFANNHGIAGSNLTTVKPEEDEPPSLSTLPSTLEAGASNTGWETGNWSQCSTTCGLGAIWRTVRCSTGKEQDCNSAQKPVPARRCYLKPCSTWRVGNWSKCSRTCGHGVKVRDVFCVDTRDQRPLRPFHCQAILHKPPIEMPCQSKPCLTWYTSAWRECSELCGGGEQERLVTCPEVGRCDEALRPNNKRPCHSHPCTRWTVGSWGQCTATCGGGIQRRQVKCVNSKTGAAEEDNSLCDHEPWPENTQKCNTQDCSHSESSATCERDRLSFSFCQTLLFLGRCHLPTVSIQCCQTCHQHAHGPRDRGNERASRK